MIISCQWTRLHYLTALRFNKIALFQASPLSVKVRAQGEEPGSKVIDELKSTNYHATCQIGVKLTVRIALQTVWVPQW